MARDDAAPASGDARLACVDFDLTVLARHSFAERVTVERVEALELRDLLQSHASNAPTPAARAGLP